MLRSILVPLDGSTFGEHALPMAAGLARRAGATLHLVHVHQPVPPATVAGVAIMDAIDLHLRQDEQAYLSDVVRRLNECKPLPIQTALLDGDVIPALHTYADEHKADLVIMSTHGRGALGRFWLGSVADDLIRDLPDRPMLLVRPSEGKPDLHREVELKSIVIPLDGTALAEQAIEPALAVGKLFDATYTLVRVNKPVVRPSYLPEGATILGLTHSVLEKVHELQQHAQEESEKYLGAIVAKLEARGIRALTRVVIDEQPGVGIMLEAQARHADLIAMETHGRRGLSRLLVGSVADKVVRGGVVPVLLHRPKQ